MRRGASGWRAEWRVEWSGRWDSWSSRSCSDALARADAAAATSCRPNSIQGCLNHVVQNGANGYTARAAIVAADVVALDHVVQNARKG